MTLGLKLFQRLVCAVSLFGFCQVTQAQGLEPSIPKTATPGLALSTGAALQAPAAVTPNHFAQKPGWTWVYRLSSHSSNTLLSSSRSDTLWLTLKAYRESGSQFFSTWSVSLTSAVSNAKFVPPTFNTESNYSWTDTNVTVNGVIDSGMHYNDFLPQAYKVAEALPPLFLNHCNLPAVLSHEPSSGYATIENPIKPPFYVYSQFKGTLVRDAIYKDSVGLVGLTTEIPLEGSYSIALPLIYFGKKPPERPVSMAHGPGVRQPRRSKADLSRNYGSSRVRLKSSSQHFPGFTDGLGRSFR